MNKTQAIRDFLAPMVARSPRAVTGLRVTDLVALLNIIDDQEQQLKSQDARLKKLSRRLTALEQCADTTEMKELLDAMKGADAVLPKAAEAKIAEAKAAEVSPEIATKETEKKEKASASKKADNSAKTEAKSEAKK